MYYIVGQIKGLKDKLFMRVLIFFLILGIDKIVSEFLYCLKIMVLFNKILWGNFNFFIVIMLNLEGNLWFILEYYYQKLGK